jgi:MFS family permease
MYVYFIPLFAQRFGATFLDLGYIGTIASLTYAVVPIFVGHLADRISRYRLYALSLLLNFVATITLVLSRSVNDIILIRGLGGLGQAFYWPITETLVLELAPRGKRVKEMGLYSVSWGSAYLIGPLLGGVIIQAFGFVKLFIIASALVMLAFVQAVVTVLPHHQQTGGRTFSVSESFRVMRRLWPWYVLVVCYGMIFNIITAIFPGYASSVGISAVLIGGLFTVFGITRISSYATVERYLHFGERKAIVLASLLIGVGCLAIAFCPSFYSFLGAIAIMGGCFAIIFPLTIGLISRHFRDEQAGAAVGSYETVLGIGNAIGPIYAGTVAAISNVQLSFMTVSLFTILMVIIAATGKMYSKN